MRAYLALPRRSLFVLVLLVVWVGVARAEVCVADRVDLRGPWGNARFTVELAVTPEEQARGLMHRESLPRFAGMLFVFDTPRRASFWMKNTLIPLDMLFVDPSGVVTHIHENAVPGSLETIEGGTNILAVLEINGGMSRRIGIGVGAEMRHPAFDSDVAVWPCPAP